LCPASEDAETLDRSFILLCWKFQEPETIDWRFSHFAMFMFQWIEPSLRPDRAKYSDSGNEGLQFSEDRMFWNHGSTDLKQGVMRIVCNDDLWLALMEKSTRERLSTTCQHYSAKRGRSLCDSRPSPIGAAIHSSDDQSARETRRKKAVALRFHICCSEQLAHLVFLGFQ
jgi:hypothetical protein